MQSPDELRQEYEALGECASTRRAANLRISVSLDIRTVLKKVVERAWGLSQFGPCSQNGEVPVPCGGFGCRPELNN